jgi:hypothetical protein
MFRALREPMPNNAAMVAITLGRSSRLASTHTLYFVSSKAGTFSFVVATDQSVTFGTQPLIQPALLLFQAFHGWDQ